MQIDIAELHLCWIVIVVLYTISIAARRLVTLSQITTTGIQQSCGYNTGQSTCCEHVMGHCRAHAVVDITCGTVHLDGQHRLQLNYSLC